MYPSSSVTVTSEIKYAGGFAWAWKGILQNERAISVEYRCQLILNEHQIMPLDSVLIVFENMEKAKAWSDSAETKAIRAIRDRTAKIRAFLSFELKGHARFDRASND